MEVVTISPKYQVVIPLSIRKSLGLRPGQKVEMTERDGHVELVVLKPVSAYRGFLPGIETDVPNDDHSNDPAERPYAVGAIRPVWEYRGILRGSVNDFERESDREF